MQTEMDFGAIEHTYIYPRRPQLDRSRASPGDDARTTRLPVVAFASEHGPSSSSRETTTSPVSWPVRVFSAKKHRIQTTKVDALYVPLLLPVCFCWRCSRTSRNAAAHDLGQVRLAMDR